jgi:hypothetical protein
MSIHFSKCISEINGATMRLSTVSLWSTLMSSTIIFFKNNHHNLPRHVKDQRLRCGLLEIKM